MPNIVTLAHSLDVNYTSGEFVTCVSLVVKLFVHFCVCVSKSLRKWTQTDTKVTFHNTHQETFFGLK